MATGTVVLENPGRVRLNEESKMPDAGKSKSSNGSFVSFFGGSLIACAACDEFLTPVSLLEYLLGGGGVGDSAGGVVMKLSSRGILCSSPALKSGVNDSGSGESVL